MLKFIAAIGLIILISTAALASEYSTNYISTMTSEQAVVFINQIMRNWTSKDIGGYVLRHVKAYPDFHPRFAMSYHDTDTENYRMEIQKSFSIVEQDYLCSSVEIWLSHVNKQYDGRKNYFSSRLCIKDDAVHFRGLTSRSPALQ